MSRRVPTIFDDLFPDSSPEFQAIAETWPEDVIIKMLTLVWDAFDRIKTLPGYKNVDFSKDYAQLERCLTDLHNSQVTLLYAQCGSGFESFIPQHEPWEFESLSARSARPPSSDIGFVLRANLRLRWSVEAKVLNCPTDITLYLGDLEKYLEGKSSPFSTEAALAGYLIKGESKDVFAELESVMKTAFRQFAPFPSRPHRITNHLRKKEKLPLPTPSEFICHHLVFVLN